VTLTLTFDFLFA